MLKTAGRRDIEAFFSQSGVLFAGKLPHTPFLAFVDKDDDVQVEIVDKVEELLQKPDETKVMAQWRGDWRSDFFQFTVGEIREAYERINPQGAVALRAARLASIRALVPEPWPGPELRKMEVSLRHGAVVDLISEVATAQDTIGEGFDNRGCTILSKRFAPNGSDATFKELAEELKLSPRYVKELAQRDIAHLTRTPASVAAARVLKEAVPPDRWRNEGRRLPTILQQANPAMTLPAADLCVQLALQHRDDVQQGYLKRRLIRVVQPPVDQVGAWSTLAWSWAKHLGKNHLDEAMLADDEALSSSFIQAVESWLDSEGNILPCTADGGTPIEVESWTNGPSAAEARRVLTRSRTA